MSEMIDTNFSMEPTLPRFTQNISPLESQMNVGPKKLLLVFASIAAVMIFWVWVNNPMLVTVTGTGEVSVPATNATLSFTLSASDNSISSAVSSVQGKADTMRAYLISKGVAEGDIAQSQVTAIPAGLVTAGASGFQARISMAAKTTHVSSVGGLVADLYTNGALVVSQPVLSVENQDKLDQEALDKALKDASSQAFAMGLKKWKIIKKVVSISQVSSPTTSTSTTKADSVTENANTVAALNGVFKIVKAVSVSYKLW
ncbi:MAG TPA: SIMPL domain-containing protein [Patescibacteria group bacterium]|nr:SIMPL domain-containing protein [Patescibacteria group bacterium]